MHFKDLTALALIGAVSFKSDVSTNFTTRARWLLLSPGISARKALEWTKEVMTMAAESGFTVWISALKIVLGLGVMVGAIGGALWYADKLPAYSPAQEQARQQVPANAPNSTPSSDKSWGIAHDSPIRSK